MPAPTDLNSQIAYKKGWTWVEDEDYFFTLLPHPTSKGNLLQTEALTHWRTPEGKPAIRPDFVGTLEGVAGLMRELQVKQDRRDQRMVWSWNYCTIKQAYRCNLRNVANRFQHAIFWSPDDRPGDCVGEAYMSVKGETDDGD